MLSESSKKLKLYKLINSDTNEEEARVYLYDYEAEIKNRAYITNKSSKRYVLVENKITKLSK